MSTSLAPAPILEGTRVSQMWRVEVQNQGESRWTIVHQTEHQHLAERTLNDKNGCELKERYLAARDGKIRTHRRYRLVTWNETTVRADLRVVSE
jgi:hypothetical protein